jgi:hypothetical protein
VVTISRKEERIVEKLYEIHTNSEIMNPITVTSISIRVPLSSFENISFNLILSPQNRLRPAAEGWSFSYNLI